MIKYIYLFIPQELFRNCSINLSTYLFLLYLALLLSINYLST